jgi:hypothetical protein
VTNITDTKKIQERKTVYFFCKNNVDSTEKKIADVRSMDLLGSHLSINVLVVS